MDAPPRRRAGSISDVAMGGMTAGRYRHQKVLGTGGMGQVLQVVDESTGRVLALKRLGGKSADPASERARLRFEREFHTLARLQHPRILGVYDYGIDAGIPYFTMELLDGCDLQELGIVPWNKACEILRDVCSALAFLHARDLIHRDLNPRNVRLSTNGSAKLIDFGVLATVGHSGDAAGTPSLIAPESFTGLSIDHRSDLFSLGGLAYWLLSGSYAYPARSVAALPGVWRERPAELSHLVPEVPDPLNALVMTLLSIDPAGRPSSAAEVIDRLAAIAGLDPAPELEVSRGYLASVPMVGRHRELARLRELLAAARHGHGSLVVVEAPSGTGKTRVLRELGLEAQLAGYSVVTVRCGESSALPYGLFHLLRSEVEAVIPESAREPSDHPRARLPSFTLEARRRNDNPGPLNTEDDLVGLRMRRQEMIVRWVAELAGQRPLALLVDDLQRCDEVSVSALAALAREAGKLPLLMVVSIGTDEPCRAEASVQAIQRLGERVRLGALDIDSIQEFLRYLFGDVPRLPRLASWALDSTAGIPLNLVEQARELVDSNRVHYLGGTWVLPFELPAATGGAGAHWASGSRLAGLSPMARSMAEAMAVYGEPVSVDDCIPLSGCCSNEAAFVALDELERQGIVIGAAGVYRFRHDKYREASLQGIPEERRRRLHLSAGEAILSQASGDSSREADAGWHLYKGGDVLRGARLLDQAGRRLFEEQALRDCASALETAVAAYTAEGQPASACLELEYMLLASGAMYDRPLGLRHAGVVDAYHRHIGFAAAEQLRRYIGRPLALAVGFCKALMSWAFTRPAWRGTFPVRAIGVFYLALMYAGGLQSASTSPAGLRRLAELARPAAVLGIRVLSLAVVGLEAALALSLGHFGAAITSFRYTLQQLRTDRASRWIAGDFQRRIGEAGLRAQLALAEALTLDPALAQEHQAMEALDLHLSRLQIQVTRVIERRLRGAEPEARAIEEQLETQSLQLGSSWMIDAWLARYGALGHALCRDVVGLKRSVDQLQMLVDKGLELEPQLALARGEYYRERGELAASSRQLEDALQSLDPEECFTRLWVLSAAAETCLASGDFEGAARVARQCVELASRPDSGHPIPRLRAIRALSLAEAGTGSLFAASARINAAMAEAAVLRCPPIEGALHEARARIALLEGDREAFALHCSATSHHFLSTRNPSLVALAERLAASRELVFGAAGREQRAARADISTVVESVTCPHMRPANDAAAPSGNREPA